MSAAKNRQILLAARPRGRSELRQRAAERCLLASGEAFDSCSHACQGVLLQASKTGVN